MQREYPSKGGCIPDGSVYTGFYPYWREISDDKRQKVQSARENKKLSKKTESKFSEIKNLIKKVSNIKRSLSQLKVKEGGDTSIDEDIAPNNARIQFGGRNKKQKNKE